MVLNWEISHDFFPSKFHRCWSHHIHIYQFRRCAFIQFENWTFFFRQDDEKNKQQLTIEMGWSQPASDIICDNRSTMVVFFFINKLSINGIVTKWRHIIEYINRDVIKKWDYLHVIFDWTKQEKKIWKITIWNDIKIIEKSEPTTQIFMSYAEKRRTHTRSDNRNAQKARAHRRNRFDCDQ